MSERLYDYLEITDLKDMLNKTNKLYGEKIAYKLRQESDEYKYFTHSEIREMVDSLGTMLINMGLKNKRIAVIGENRYEWEIAYLSIVCGTGVVVPLDKSLPENNLKTLIIESEVEAIFCSDEYIKTLEKFKNKGIGKLKYIISMDSKEENKDIYSMQELINNGMRLLETGDKRFINAKINPKEMSIMLFTSGTTSKAKVVALSHENICTNLMDLASVLDINSNDIILSVLPLHHVYECTVGFLLSLYKGSQIVFCDGIRHLVENIKEYKISVMSCVPALYERIFKMIIKKIEKEGNLKETLLKLEQSKNLSMGERKKVFYDIHDMLGGNIKLLISGAAPLDKSIEEKYRLFGFNMVQAYGLTETSPVIGIGNNKFSKIGSVGKNLPSVEVKVVNKNSEGEGELVVKGKSIMLGYFQNEIANKNAIVDGWFHTGDLAKIDDEGYIFICGRKKSVIVLKNGKNIYPEEMENLINRIDGVNESFVFGKQKADDKDDIKINAKLVFDRSTMKEIYNVNNDKEIYAVLSKEIKQINKLMPEYKAIRGFSITEEPLIKTTTNKIKRQENLDAIE